jgi:hypothetical protein
MTPNKDKEQSKAALCGIVLANHFDAACRR